jgi:pSer/pThr/pTyr-binding forkhead associated (FHA) protein
MAEKTQQMPPDDPLRTQALHIGDIQVTQTIEPVQCPVCKTHNPAGEAFCVECGLVFASALPPDVFSAPAVTFPCLVDTSGHQHFLRPGVNLVGRMGDVLLSDSRVSRRHAEIVVEAGPGEFAGESPEGEEASLEQKSEGIARWVIRIRDLGSTNGTRVNEETLPPDEWRDLREGDKVEFGGVTLRVSIPSASPGASQVLAQGKTQMLATPPGEQPSNQEPSAAPVAWLVGEEEEFPLKSGETRIGRKSGNDIVLNDPYVSKEHATIEAREDGFFITDLGSTNGVMLNGARIPSHQPVRFGPEDEIAIGQRVYRLRLRESESDE